MDEKQESILRHGIMSPYWAEYTNSLPWESESAEAKLYIAGTLHGFSHDFVFRIIAEQAQLHGDNFKNQGFFIWTEFFEKLKDKAGIEKELLDGLDRLEKLRAQNHLDEHEFQVAKRKLLGID
jgi:hypothetical protein